jgi:hypothetical protein
MLHTSIDIDVLNSDWIMLNAIKLHSSDVVVINREGVEWTAGDGDQTETVTLALLHVNDGPWDFRLRGCE